MDSTNSFSQATIYFWRHSGLVEANGRIIRNILPQVDNIYLECVLIGEGIEGMRVTEQVPVPLHQVPEQSGRQNAILAEHLISIGASPDTPTRFENILMSDEQAGRGSYIADAYARFGTWEESFQAMQFAHSNTAQEKLARDNYSGEKIGKLEGNTLAFFGAAHSSLAQRVAEHKPVQVAFPFDDYPESIQMVLHRIPIENERFEEFALCFGFEIYAKAVLTPYVGEMLSYQGMLSMIAMYTVEADIDFYRAFRDAVSPGIREGLGWDSQLFFDLVERHSLPCLSDMVRHVVEKTGPYERYLRCKDSPFYSTDLV